ncbi:protein indc11 [Hypoxylon fragiforme]|uniref:protein indc11 n=1 Tax=Hypoxylon fragiforme TaxID=63214 RepID=UPI0020C69889|nr:protein indc11 [Hypoxylon fragiforme]KAI2609391.1 protein indc11 [Hypoxylon fragiforme]
MTAIRKVLIPTFGDVSVLRVVDDVCPPPPKGHLQITTLYSGFSGADISMRKGTYPFQRKAPLTPGYCLTGTVRAVGEGCAQGFQAGDTVAVMTKYDSEATVVNQPEKYCVKVPAGVDVAQATALILDWNTAYGMVKDTAQVSKGQKVFVHGMSGGVGAGLVALSLLRGAAVYGTASPRNHAAVRERGGTPFAYSDKAWQSEMRALGGADVVFDPLGYESFDESFAILSPRGFLVGYGNNKGSLAASGAGGGEAERRPAPAMAKLLAHNLNVFCAKRTTFYGITRDSGSYLPNARELLDLLRSGTIRVPIKKVWDMEEVQEAHRGWATGNGIGSVLLKVARD